MLGLCLSGYRMCPFHSVFANSQLRRSASTSQLPACRSAADQTTPKDACPGIVKKHRNHVSFERPRRDFACCQRFTYGKKIEIIGHKERACQSLTMQTAQLKVHLSMHKLIINQHFDAMGQWSNKLYNGRSSKSSI